MYSTTPAQLGAKSNSRFYSVHGRQARHVSAKCPTKNIWPGWRIIVNLNLPATLRQRCHPHRNIANRVSPWPQTPQLLNNRSTSSTLDRLLPLRQVADQIAAPQNGPGRHGAIKGNRGRRRRPHKFQGWTRSARMCCGQLEQAPLQLYYTLDRHYIR